MSPARTLVDALSAGDQSAEELEALQRSEELEALQRAVAAEAERRWPGAQPRPSAHDIVFYDDKQWDGKRFCKRDAMSEFGVTGRQLDAAPCEFARNPVFASASAMRLYDADDLFLLSLQRHGSMRGLEEYKRKLQVRREGRAIEKEERARERRAREEELARERRERALQHRQLLYERLCTVLPTRDDAEAMAAKRAGPYRDVDKDEVSACAEFFGKRYASMAVDSSTWVYHFTTVPPPAAWPWQIGVTPDEWRSRMDDVPGARLFERGDLFAHCMGEADHAAHFKSVADVLPRLRPGVSFRLHAVTAASRLAELSEDVIRAASEEDLAWYLRQAERPAESEFIPDQASLYITAMRNPGCRFVCPGATRRCFINGRCVCEHRTRCARSGCSNTPAHNCPSRMCGVCCDNADCGRHRSKRDRGAAVEEGDGGPAPKRRRTES